MLARWVSGVNTVRLKSISVHVIPDSSKPIELSILGEVVDLKMSAGSNMCGYIYLHAISNKYFQKTPSIFERMLFVDLL